MEKRKPGRPSRNDSRRKEILQAAHDSFVQYGYDKTTLDYISNILKFNKAALYYYYKNKEDIFIHVFKDELANGLQKLREDNNKITDINERILNFFKERSIYFLNLTKLHGITKFNFIELYDDFSNRYEPFLMQEISYIKDNLKLLNPKYSDDKISAFANNLFYVSSAITVSGVIINNITTSKESFRSMNEKKHEILEQYLASF